MFMGTFFLMERLWRLNRASAGSCLTFLIRHHLLFDFLKNLKIRNFLSGSDPGPDPDLDPAVKRISGLERLCCN